MNEFFKESPIQTNTETKMVGSLIWTTYNTDLRTLEETIERESGIKINLRYGRIPDKSFGKGSFSKDDPKAALVTCDAYKEIQVEQYLIKTYSSQNKKFPLGIKLQFLPAYDQYTDLQSKDKFDVLQNRQGHFAKQTQAKMRPDIVKVDRIIGDKERQLGQY